MKIYIAGAITNNPNYKEHFKAAEERLKAAGHAVINPCKNDGFTYREYINMGLCELMHCDAIYLLKGYDQSTGATLEHDYARTVRLTIIMEEDELKDWEKAKDNVLCCMSVAACIPSAIHCVRYLRELLDRFIRGERTDELYTAMLEVH